ncbi:MAG: hypothetical protein ACK553_00160 [Planctomycetota bacterium]
MNKHWTISLLFIAFLGCNPLAPRAIPLRQHPPSPSLLEANTTPIERGKPRPIVDAVGYVFGIPSKILLWNSRIENHRISPETESTLRDYLASNQLDHVKVRLNQYRPFDDFRRLTANQDVAWPWRYSLGVFSVLGETLIPGRLFGTDHFNPYTNTIHLYSDVPAIALHEAAHAKDFARRTYPGTYAFAYGLPIVPLYHESIASAEVIAYLEALGRPDLQREAYHVLYPAYGTYVGGALGFAHPPATAPIYYGSVIGGHLAGRLQSRTIPDSPSGPAREQQHGELSSQSR